MKCYLVEYVVSPPASGHLQQLVQALGALVDEHVPAAVVVALAGQSLDLERCTEKIRGECRLEIIRGEKSC